MDHRSLSIINPQPRRLDGPTLLHNLISPASDSIALEHLNNTGEKSRYTYADLHATANRIASKICQASAHSSTQQIVPLLLAQTPLLYAVQLGILKAGAAFCPLNVDAPSERIKFILQDVAATVIIVTPDLRDRLPEVEGVEVLTLSEDEFTRDDTEVFVGTEQKGSLAYVMYTSGSTGVPKGVTLSHDAATQALMAHDEHIPSFERFLQFAAPTFDVSVFEIFFPLIRGKTLISVDRQQMLNDLPAALNETQVDACELTPSVAAGLLRTRSTAPGLKLLLTIGEMLNVSVVNEFGGSKDRESMLWAMYGPTEATIHCTLKTAFNASSPVGMIGLPLATVSCFVADTETPLTPEGHLNILRQGEVGELVVGGYQLADGYLNRPEKTAEAFIDCATYGRLYRTGDRAKLNDAGLLECMGRLVDGQVKLRGQRIELGEIEHAMLRTEGCHVVVAAVIDGILVGFCVANDPSMEDAILQTCTEWLTPNMIPSEIVIMSDFPRLPSGKVDKAKLKADFKASSESQNSPQLATYDTVEAAVIQSISSVSQVEAKLNQTLSFLGISSLLAIQLASALRQYGYNIAVADILKLRTVSDLCQYLRTNTASDVSQNAMSPEISLQGSLSIILSDVEGLAINAEDVQDIFPCTPLQTAMLSATKKDSWAYVNEIYLEADNSLALDDIQSALQKVILANEVLRTSFVEWEDGFVSVIVKKPHDNIIHRSGKGSMDILALPLSIATPLQFCIEESSALTEDKVKITVRIHHAAYDGWSMDAILSDLNAILAGDSYPVRPPFHHITQHVLATDQSEKSDSLSWWADHLAGWERSPFPKLLERPVLPPSSKRGKTLDISVSSEALVAAMRETGCSKPSFLLGAISLVWKGILGASDVVLGNVTSGRTLAIPGIESIIGPCMASLPLRVNFATVQTVRQLVKSIERANRQIMEHSTLSHSEIRQAASLQSWETLYDVLFAYQQSIYSESSDVRKVTQSGHLDRLETSLLIEAEPTDFGFSLQGTWRTDVLDGDVVGNLLEQIGVVTQKLVTNYDKSFLDLGPNCGYTLQKSVNNHPPHLLGQIPDIASSFEDVASKSPLAVAIDFAQPGTEGFKQRRTISYSKLNEQANQAARSLRGEGAQTGDVVAIVMEKSIDLYIGILAIMKAGCAYLPLLPTTPQNRIDEVFNQANITHCFSDHPSKPLSSKTDVIYLSTSGDSTAKLSTENLDIQANGDRLSYVIFTSGTTGRPKGVAVTQENITTNVAWLRKHYPVSSNTQDRLMQACSQAFDVSVFEIFFTWLSGMRLCTGTHDTIFSDIEYACRAFEITHLSLTPTVAALIDPKNAPSLRFLVTAGEALTRGVLEKFGDMLWQGYGPSETTNICTVKQMSRKDNIENLGRVFGNTSAIVLGLNSTSELPPGWAGELCFGGYQVAQGYLNAPQLTAEKFIDHPTYGRLYRSGDFGRMLPNGTLVTMGRMDDQVKLRGQRIEPAEIDRVMTIHGQVAAAATLLIALESETGPTQALVSFWTTDASQSEKEVELLTVSHDSMAELIVAVKSHLPSYMVPSYLVPVTSIPRTASGKTDRARLVAFFKTLSAETVETTTTTIWDGDDVAEWTDLESKIRSTVAACTNYPASKLGRWTSFSMLGIDSIAAIKVSRALTQELEQQVAISTLLTNNCVALLARRLSDSPGSGPLDLETIRPLVSHELSKTILRRFDDQVADDASVLPCTPLQEAMLVRGRSYYNHVLFKLLIDPEMVQSCWEKMTDRHGILRTCFVSTDDQSGAILQVVLTNWHTPWKTFRSLDSIESAKAEHLQSLPDPVDSQVPPISMAVVQADDQQFLSFVCHHALYDGAAMEVLWNEMEAAIQGHELPSSVSFEPFLRQVKAVPEGSEKFWLSHLNDFKPYRAFTTATPKRMSQVTHSITLSNDYSELQKRMRNIGTSLLSLTQAAWAMTLAIATGSQDVCFGNIVSGRTVDVPDVDRLVAPCFNTLPIRCVLDTTVQNSQLMKEFNSLNRDMLPYQFTPLRDVRRLVGSLERPLFETLLLLQTPEHERDHSIWEIVEDEGQMDVPIVCEVSPNLKTDSVKLTLHFDINSLAESEATTIAAGFSKIINELSNAPLSNVSIAPIADLKQIRTPEGLNYSIETGDSSTSNTESWSDLEAIVRGVFCTLSNAPSASIRRTTTIHRLGLDSINTVQVASILRSQGYTLSATDVQECPTCEALAQRLSDNADKSDNSVVAGAYDFESFRDAVREQAFMGGSSNLTIEDILPCSPVQCAMAASAIHSGGSSYINLVKYDLDKGFSIKQVTSALEAVRRQHGMLRSAIARVDHQDASFAMVRYSEKSLKLPVTQQYTTPDAAQLRGDCAQDCMAKPHLPPWRGVLCQESDTMSLYLIMHHALYDAWSLQSILENFARALKDLPLENVQDPSIALSHVLAEAEKDNAEDAAFWKGLATKAVVNRFPVLTSLRQEDKSVQTMAATSRLSFSQLQSHSVKLGVSVQTIIEAAWTRILAAYTGEDSVVFGVTLSDRFDEATQDTPIPCLTTMPVVAGNAASTRELLESLQAYNAHLARHRRCGLSQVQSWLGHPGSPVFDTLITYQGRERLAETSRPFTVSEEVGEVDFPVSLEIEPKGNDTIHLALTFQKSIMPSEQADIILKQFDATWSSFLDSDAHDVSTQLARSDIYSIMPAEIPHMPTHINALHEFVEERAAQGSQVVALDYAKDLETPSQTWTYPQLNDNGNRVSAMVRELAHPRNIVAIHFNKCPEAYFSILGILKSGCAFVALDPAMPPSRKEFIVQDSGAKCLLIREDDTIDFEPGVPVLRINEEKLHEVAPAETTVQIDPQDTCYCLYTSGTTGTPKGCELTHENAVQAMLAFQALFKGRWKADSRWLQFAALHFDVSVLEQYWTWSVGITMVACPRDVVLDDLAGAINGLKITHIDLTPSLARLLDPEDVPCLWDGVFITGGESLKQEILDKWGPKGVIHNSYGPTEATIGVTTYPCVPQHGRPSNIGKQFLNVGTYVLQPGTSTPVLKGAVGELCLAGKLVGKGYLNRPDLTEKNFPYLKDLGERVYRTGDLVRVLADGCFDFIGRADDQVKLRGQRLEIGEINHAIRDGASEITDIATIVVTEKSTDRSLLVSFIVGEHLPDQELRVLADAQGLGQKARSAAKAKLPGYMVPTYFLLLPHIPLSINNKAELKVLKKLFEAIPASDLVALNASSNSQQTNNRLLPKVRDALSLFTKSSCEELPSSANIFDLGVDSITVLRLSSALKAQGLANCSSATILQNPIIGDLAAALDVHDSSDRKLNLINDAKMRMRACEQSQIKAAQDIMNLTGDEIEYILPCSPLQEGMVTAALTRGLYFVSLELALADHVKLSKLQAAWATLVKANAILRTAFLDTSDGCIQVAKLKDLSWEQVTTAEARDFRRQAWVSGNSEHILEPLQLTVLENEQRKLYIDIFHGAYDGLSLDVMLSEVAELYQGGQLQTSPSFSSALAYGPLWRYDFSKEFWQEHLDGWTPAAVWPSTLTQGPKKPSVPVSSSLTLPADTVSALLKEHRVTMQSLLLAIWSSVLESNNGSTSTGLIISGRSIDLDNIDATIGPMFNTLPFSPDSCQENTLAGLIKYCQDFVTSTLEFQHVPLKNVQKWCSKGQGLFNNLFTVQVESQDVKGALWKVEDSVAELDYPLAFEATVKVTGDVQLNVVADNAYLNESETQALLASFKEQLIMLQNDASARWKANASISPSFDSSPGIATPTSSMDSENFEWTPAAETIRQELAALAQASEDIVTPNTTVLQLGLDSIDVLKMSSRLRKKGIDLPASKILRYQTIEGIVRNENVEAGQNGNQDAGPRKLAQLRDALSAAVQPSEEVEAVYPATPLQEGMVMGMVQSEFAYYFNHEVLELSATIDVDRLCQAWSKIVRDNDILRTGFVEISEADLDASYAQIVYKDTKFVPTLHSSTASDDIVAAATKAAIEQGGKRDLLQVAFTTIGEKTLMVISIAHALYDGWSLSLLYQDLRNAYDAANVQSRPGWDAYLAERAVVDEKESEKFWKGFLGGAKETIVSRQGQERATSEAAIKMELTSKVEVAHMVAFCKRHGISSQALSYAAWSVYVAHQTKQLDVTFGVVLSGRDFDGAEDLMFPTMNTIAHRAILHGSCVSFMEYVERNLQDIRQYQGYPLRKAQRLAGRGGNLFDSLFMLQRSPGGGSHDKMFKSVEGTSRVDYPLAVEAEAVGDTLIWRIAAQEGLYDAAEVSEILQSIDKLLGYMMEKPEEPLLHSSGDGFSICGLPTTKMRDDPNGQDSKDDDSNDNFEWKGAARQIRQILSSVSHVPEDDIRPSNTIYHLGLDSISVVKVSSLLRKQGIFLKGRDLTGQSIAEMMQTLNSSRSDHGTATSTSKDEPLNWATPAGLDFAELEAQHGINSDHIEYRLPVNAMQSYMLGSWFSSGGKICYPDFKFSLPSSVTNDDVSAAWKQIRQEFPVLRTSFLATGDARHPFIQVVLRNGCDQKSDDWVSCWVEQRPNKDSILHLKIHHALYDAFSLPVVANRLLQLTQGPASSASPRESSLWARKVIKPTVITEYESARKFWKQYLSGVTVDVRSDPVADAGRTSLIKRGMADSAKLRAAAAGEGVSAQALFLACYARYMSQLPDHQSSQHVVFGVYLANRDDHDDDGDAASPYYPTLSIVPLKVAVSSSLSLGSMALAIQHDLRTIKGGNAEYGLLEIYEWTGIKVDSVVNFVVREEVIDEEVKPADNAELELGDGGQSLDAICMSEAQAQLLNGVYSHIAEVEASLDDDGLTVGAFGSERRITKEGAVDIVDGIASIIERFLM